MVQERGHSERYPSDHSKQTSTTLSYHGQQAVKVISQVKSQINVPKLIFESALTTFSHVFFFSLSLALLYLVFFVSVFGSSDYCTALLHYTVVQYIREQA